MSWHKWKHYKNFTFYIISHIYFKKRERDKDWKTNNKQNKGEPAPERMFKAHSNGVDSVVFYFFFFYFCLFLYNKTTDKEDSSSVPLSFQSVLIKHPAKNSIYIKMVNSMIAYWHRLCVLEHSPRIHWKYVNILLCYFKNNLYIIHFLNNRAWKITLMLYLALEIVSEVPIIGIHTCSLIKHIYL